MYTDTRERSGLMRTGKVEEVFLGAGGGAYSGMVMISNCETNEMVMLL